MKNTSYGFSQLVPALARCSWRLREDGKRGDRSFPRSQHPRKRGLQRDAEGLEGQPLTRAHCHGGVPAAFPRKLLTNGSRAISVGTETSTTKGRNWKLRSHGAPSFILSNSCMSASAARADTSKSRLRSRISVKHGVIPLKVMSNPMRLQGIDQPVMCVQTTTLVAAVYNFRL
jgi:hypothetical protein